LFKYFVLSYISQWMSDRRGNNLLPGDIVV